MVRATARVGSCSLAVWAISGLLLVSGVWSSGQDPCDTQLLTEFSPQEQAVVCYAGNFLVKMLTELNSGNAKTAEHVRMHLLPYLGGEPALAALLTDDLDSPTCTVCHKSVPAHDGLLQLRNGLSAPQLQAYDQLRACYHTLTQRIMSRLPKDDQGLYLSPTTSPEHDSFQQATYLFKSMFRSTSYDKGSCRLDGTRV